MESGGSALPSPSNGAALGLKKLVLALVLQTISFLKINNNQWFVALMKRHPWTPIFSKIRSLRNKVLKILLRSGARLHVFVAELLSRDSPR
jgi:hypothetical protein